VRSRPADRRSQPRSDRTLDPAAANGLTAAMLLHLAAGLGVRAVLLKGLSLEYHGLRTNHSSSDVDILVEPMASSRLFDALQLAGWLTRSETVGDAMAPHHSRTLVNPGWPSDIDLHDEYPGLLVGSDRAFEALWLHRRRTTAAAQPVWITDFASSVAIWALHSLRGSAVQGRHAEELRQIREIVLPGLSVAERQELADRIVELGADEPLRVVPEFAEIIGDRRGPQAPGALEAWNAKVAQAHEATPWLQVLRDARPSERPWLLFRAVWPSAHDLRLLDESLVDTPWGRVQSRGRRAWRLVRRIVERRRQAH